jgi:RNA polymerase sigma-70 factor (ECF subfamily)
VFDAPHRDALAGATSPTPGASARIATTPPALHTAQPMRARSPDDEGDETLMLAYARGTAQAFDALYARHRNGVYRYLLRHCASAAIADELFQDVWMSVIRARATYAPSARFATWLYTLAHHRIVDHWRASGQSTTVSADDDESVSAAVASLAASRIDEPEMQAGNREVAAHLRAALAALPPLQRDAFLLQHESGLSLAEIADMTGVGVETVKSRLRYAVAKLRTALTAFREDAANERR